MEPARWAWASRDTNKGAWRRRKAGERNGLWLGEGRSEHGSTRPTRPHGVLTE